MASSSSSSFFNESLNVRDKAQQKRKKARAITNINGEFHLNGKDEAIPCLITDLGTGGLSMQSRTTLYDGDQVVVRFRLGPNYMQLAANVSRLSGKNVGLQFTNPDEKQMEALQAYIHTAYFEKDKKKT